MLRYSQSSIRSAALKIGTLLIAVALVLFSSGVGHQRPSAVQSITMHMVLLSECLGEQKDAENLDIWPVRFVYVRLEKVGDKVSAQYREFDPECKRVFAKSSNWTVEQFENSKIGFNRAGFRDGLFIALNESSGDELPVSLLQIRSSQLNAKIYSMYLRFRWTGKMNTDDPGTAKILAEWQALFKEVTPVEREQFGTLESVRQIANGCALDWPKYLRSRVWIEAQRIVRGEGSYEDCLTQLPKRSS